MLDDPPALGRTDAGVPRDTSAALAARREQGLAILSLLAQQLSTTHDLDEAIHVSLESAMEFDHSDTGAFVQLDPDSGEITRAVEMGLSRDFVTHHVLPELMLRFKESPLSARHPYFRTCSHTVAGRNRHAPAGLFRIAIVPLLWEGRLRAALVTVGPGDRDEEILVLEALQAFVASTLALREPGLLAEEMRTHTRTAELVQTLVHDLKNPLTQIMLTASRMELSPPHRGETRMLVDQAERMKAILNNILHASRGQGSRTLVTLDLNEILLEEVNRLEADPFCHPEVIKEIRLARRLPEIRGVRTDFSVGFANILTNALHALWRCKDPTLEVASRLEGNRIVVDITDNGIGIREENLPKIFEPFYSAKPPSASRDSENPTGTGLGLVSTKQHLTPYGAEFEVDSRPGRGTRFSVRIPVD